MEAALERSPDSPGGYIPRALGTGEPLGSDELLVAPLKSLPRPSILDAPITKLKGAGPKLAEAASEMGISSLGDLLRHLPHSYRDRANPIGLGDLRLGEEATVEVEVRGAKLRPTRRRRLTILEADVVDPSGKVKAVWFNRAWLADRLQPGTRLLLHGKLEKRGFNVAEHEFLDGADDSAGLHTTGIVPVHPASERIRPQKIREWVWQATPLARHAVEPVPGRLRRELRMASATEAIVASHFPADEHQAEAARERLAFEELFLYQAALVSRRGRRVSRSKGVELSPPGAEVAAWLESLPFTLTGDQQRALKEIDEDLGQPQPMQRLLMGEVGSGKTVLALYAMLRAIESGHQAALMAPTETLAEQHFLTLEPICTELGVGAALLTGSVKGELEGAQVLVGTHALIQEGVSLDDLAVAVVDEQHRFGVEQRGALAAGRSPHVLHMTATPIPRTLALTVYGDLSVTEIAKPPANRKPIVTSWVTDDRAPEAYLRLRKHLDAGRQAYVVCPLIEQSETSQARAAEAEAERLRRGELRDYRVGLLHGRLRPAERRELMASFKARELDVLVATTVIEVGVDVPNATIMIVQEADRFGLAQLHQLRGRVGRGAEQSYCLLVSRAKEELTDNARERLQALVETTDGFELAEKDLELRGEGRLLGTRQAGLSEFRFTRLRADRALLERARELAGELVACEGPLDDEVERFFAAAEVDSLA